MKWFIGQTGHNQRMEVESYLKVAVKKVQYHHACHADGELDVGRVLRQIMAEYAM